MIRDELINSISEIGTCEDETERLSRLTSLSENMSKVFDEVDLLKKSNETLQESLVKKDEELTTAQKYNMEMFLKLEAERKESSMEMETGIKEEEKPVYKSYSELGKNYL